MDRHSSSSSNWLLLGCVYTSRYAYSGGRRRLNQVGRWQHRPIYYTNTHKIPNSYINNCKCQMYSERIQIRRIKWQEYHKETAELLKL